MGEHGVSWENMENMENTENMEKMENVNHKTKNTLFMNTLFVTQNILFAKQMTQKLYLFYGIYVDGSKNHNIRARGT